MWSDDSKGRVESSEQARIQQMVDAEWVVDWQIRKGESERKGKGRQSKAPGTEKQMRVKYADSQRLRGPFR